MLDSLCGCEFHLLRGIRNRFFGVRAAFFAYQLEKTSLHRGNYARRLLVGNDVDTDARLRQSHARTGQKLSRLD